MATSIRDWLWTALGINTTPPSSGIEPTSSIGRAVHSARLLCADSETFVNRLQLYSPGVTHSMDRVFLMEAEAVELRVETLADVRPMIVVGLADDINWSAITPGCTQIQLELSGAVVALIFDNVHFNSVHIETETGVIDGPDNIGDAEMDFLNFAGGVVDDMSGKFGGALDLSRFESCSMVGPPERSEYDHRQNDDYFMAVIQFNFGSQN